MYHLMSAWHEIPRTIHEYETRYHRGLTSLTHWGGNKMLTMLTYILFKFYPTFIHSVLYWYIDATVYIPNSYQITVISTISKYIMNFHTNLATKCHKIFMWLIFDICVYICSSYLIHIYVYSSYGAVHVNTLCCIAQLMLSFICQVHMADVDLVDVRHIAGWPTLKT